MEVKWASDRWKESGMILVLSGKPLSEFGGGLFDNRKARPVGFVVGLVDLRVGDVAVGGE